MNASAAYCEPSAPSIERYIRACEGANGSPLYGSNGAFVAVLVDAAINGNNGTLTFWGGALYAQYGSGSKTTGLVPELS